VKYRYLGIDLGTSSVKLILIEASGEVVCSVSRDYPLIFPHPGWSEQDPNEWWNAVSDGIKEITARYGGDSITGIGVAGQMHGLVALDKNDKVIRPAILWNDGRTSEETEWLNSVIGKGKLSSLTANIAFAGFTAPKLLWMKENEPENFSCISKIMLPKDYINYKLTGVHSCDHSDAGGTLLYDVKNRRWSHEMLGICRVKAEQMPALYESYETIGTVTPETASLLGLSGIVMVVAGAGDNAGAAVAAGAVGEGECNISVGTSGTVFIPSSSFRVDPANALHSLAHADGGYHLMGCILSAASCNSWFCGEILKNTDYADEQTDITDDKLGENRVFFLPYLMGERSPLNDTDARGAFIGLSMDTTRADMVQAVLEGVAFALRDCIEVARNIGVNISKSMLCGGGAKSPLWRKILANALDITLEIPASEGGPGYGAAMLAMVGCKEYTTVAECAAKLIRPGEVISPDPIIAAKYNERYDKFKKIYPALKGLFKELKEQEKNNERDLHKHS